MNVTFPVEMHKFLLIFTFVFLFVALLRDRAVWCSVPQVEAI